MGPIVVILCATMIWIQWMITRCQIHVHSTLFELFVHGRHKVFLEVKPIMGVCAGLFGAWRGGGGGFGGFQHGLFLGFLEFLGNAMGGAGVLWIRLGAFIRA